VLVVGLKESLDLPVRLRSPDLAKRVLDVGFMEITLERVVQTRSLILVRIDELRAVIRDYFQDGNWRLKHLTDTVKEVDTLTGRAGIGLDHVEDAPGGVVFDCQHLLALLVGVPVHVDCHASVLSLEAYPWTPPSLLVGVLGHVFVLLENLVDAVVSHRKIVSNTEHVGNGHCASASALVQFEHSFLQICWVGCVRLTSRGFQLGDFTILPVLLGELLHTSPADPELLGDDLRAHVMIDNSLTDPDDVVLIKLHFTGLIVG